MYVTVGAADWHSLCCSLWQYAIGNGADDVRDRSSRREQRSHCAVDSSRYCPQCYRLCGIWPSILHVSQVLPEFHLQLLPNELFDHRKQCSGHRLCPVPQWRHCCHHCLDCRSDYDSTDETLGLVCCCADTACAWFAAVRTGWPGNQTAVLNVSRSSAEVQAWAEQRAGMKRTRR